MSTNMKSYTGGFLNQETTRPDNQAEQQLVEITIYDEESPVTDNPFGIRYKTVNNYDGFIAVTVSWSDLPDAAIGAAFGWYDGTWHDQSVDPLAGSAKLLFPDTAVDNWGFFIDYAVGFDTRVQLGKVTPIDMEMTDTPLVISVVDNDEDKFTPIRSKQAEIQVYSSGVMDIDNFTAGGDNRFSVFIDMPYNQFALFRGFLSLGDLSQDFQPDPNTITLTATDGLGFLNDEVLVTFDGDNAINEHPLIEYAAWAFALTGQRLEIDICMNVREASATTVNEADGAAGHFFKFISVDAGMFEDEVGTSIDAYESLVRILGNMMFVTQYRGRWRIQRIDEMEMDKPLIIYRFNSEGGFIVKVEEEAQKQIGANLPLSWMNDDAVKSAQRPYKSSVLNYLFEYKRELVCNIEFERGDFLKDLPSEDIDEIPQVVKAYNIDCWTYGLHRPLGNATDTIGGEAYIKRFSYNDTETERYIQMEGTAPSSPTNYIPSIRSTPVRVNEQDKIKIGLQTKLTGGDENSRTTIRQLGMELRGADGSFWYYSALNGWQVYPAIDYIVMISDNWLGLEYDAWNGFSYETKPIPVSGKLYIYIGSDTDDNAPIIQHTDFSLDYLPFINGSYGLFTGQRRTVTYNGKTAKAVREEQVYLSDAPRVGMKGALLKFGISDYVLTSGFYDGARFPDGTLNNIPFGELQSYDVWNQFNRVMMQFEGVVDGLDSSVEIPDLINTYVLTDADKSTANRLFMVLHYEQDQHLCEFNLFLQELQDSTKPKVYDNHQFKYITANE